MDQEGSIQISRTRAAEPTDEEQKAMQKSLDSLRKDVNSLREDIARLSGATSHEGRKRYELWRDEVRDRARHLSDRANTSAQEAYDYMRQRSEEYAGSAREGIGHRPFTVVLSALVAGILLGGLFGSHAMRGRD